MRCIFCMCNSENVKGREHIIPESLGNKEHVLPLGAVCDTCNNYFAVKIESELLGSPYFKSVRHRNFILSKKGHLVPNKVLIPHKNVGWVDMWIDDKGFVFRHEDNEAIRLISDGTVNKLIIPIIEEPERNDKIMSRFLAKAALESLAYRLCSCDGWNEGIVDKIELNPLREYARYGKGEFWVYSQRRIYTEDDRFVDPINHPEPYEVLHELDMLYIDNKFMYFVLVIMGIEFAINLGGPEIETYNKWLIDNNGVSPIWRGSEYMINRK